MHLPAILGLIGWFATAILSVWPREWLISTAAIFGLAYILLDKVLPGIAPMLVADSFALVSSGCMFFYALRTFPRTKIASVG